MTLLGHRCSRSKKHKSEGKRRRLKLGKYRQSKNTVVLFQTKVSWFSEYHHLSRDSNLPCMTDLPPSLARSIAVIWRLQHRNWSTGTELQGFGTQRRLKLSYWHLWSRRYGHPWTSLGCRCMGKSVSIIDRNFESKAHWTYSLASQGSHKRCCSPTIEFASVRASG